MSPTSYREMDVSDQKMRDPEGPGCAEFELVAARGLEMEGLQRTMENGLSAISKQIQDLKVELFNRSLAPDPGHSSGRGFLSILSPRSRSNSGSGSTETHECEINQLKQDRERHRLESETWTQEKKIAEKRYLEMGQRRDHLEEENRKLNEQVRALTMERDALEREHTDLAIRLETAEKLKDDAVERCKDNENRTEATAAKAAELERMNKTLRDQTRKFRDIIIKRGSGDGEPVDDATIAATFAGLREQIQRIVFKYYHGAPVVRPKLPKNTSVKGQREFFEIWKDHLSPAELMNRTRAKLFEILDDRILSRSIFGLQSERYGNIEKALVGLESELENTNGHDAEITEWRRRTIKCVAFLPSTNTRPKEVARSIHEFMAPIFQYGPDVTGSKAKEHHDSLLLHLCEDAVTFALVLRSCKDSYKCELPKAEALLDPREDKLVAVEGAGKEPADGSVVEKVAFSLSGTLTKYPEHDPDARLILEKAHVVVFRR